MEITKLFKINNQQIILSPTQQKIFNTIFRREKPRVIAILPTQYGKSLTVALAVLLRAVSMNEKWVICAPSEKKAKIIMGYVIDRLFDNEIFYSQLEVGDSLERVKRERSKNRLTFKRGGEIMILTLDSRNGKKSMEAAMGFGSPNVILDESSLIDDPLYATVKRMLGGYKDNFLFEIGNPFYRNHFHKTWEYNDRYFKIFADYHTAIKEGRFTEDFIDEMRGEAFFDVYYECKFPDEDNVDEKGYRQLVLEVDIKKENAVGEEFEECKRAGNLKLGCDIGGGGDYNTYVIRSEKYAMVADKNKSKDTMINVSEIERLKKAYNLKNSNIFIDDIGIGRGVSDRCKEKGMGITSVTAGAKALEEKRYSNLRAEISWEAKKWIKAGNILVEHLINYKSVWDEATWIKYKADSAKKIKIEPKDELKKRTGKSPDFWEGLSLTFFKRPFIGFA